MRVAQILKGSCLLKYMGLTPPKCNNTIKWIVPYLLIKGWICDINKLFQHQIECLIHKAVLFTDKMKRF